MNFKNVFARVCFINTTVYVLHCPTSLFPRYSLDMSIIKNIKTEISDHWVSGSNPAGREILFEPKRRFIAQCLSCLSFHRPHMTEIILKGTKNRN